MLSDETHFLNALKEIVETGVTPAEELLACFDGEWGGEFEGLYRDCSY